MRAGADAPGALLRALAGDVDDEEEEGLGWQERALCAQTDPDVFFPEAGGSTGEAVQVCRRCPVQPDCLTWALRHNEDYGVWGGLPEDERRSLKRRGGAAATGTAGSPR